MNLDEVLHHRRSVRVYDKEKPIDTEKVKHCLELATLAPNSSDMQLWEFYHINPAKRKAMAVKNEKRFLKQKRNALKNPGYSRHPVNKKASFKRLLKAV